MTPDWKTPLKLKILQQGNGVSMNEIINDIESILDARTAQIVERLEGLKKKTAHLVPMDNYEHPEYDQAVGFNQALDQAINIVKSK